MCVILYVSDNSMMIHLNRCTYGDCGDVFYTNFIKKDENKTLIYVDIFKAEYLHNVMHVLLNMVQLLLFFDSSRMTLKIQIQSIFPLLKKH